LTTQQGDITRIEDVNGNVLATYEYDAWGKVISSSGSLAEINPLRYRGYYYDTETGFYYLQSRYYDPVVSRFINADRYASTGDALLGYNMFAYCSNNPVNYSDPSGEAVNSRSMLINDGGSRSILVGGALSGIKAGVDAINRGNSSLSTNTSSPNSPSNFDYWSNSRKYRYWGFSLSGDRLTVARRDLTPV
jgi:RHS repeat-associated protein